MPASPELLDPKLSGNAFSVSVVTVRDKNYILEFKPTLSAPAWKPLATVSGDGTLRLLTDVTATNSTGFYRVRLQ